MNYEKKYKEALERAKKVIKECGMLTITYLVLIIDTFLLAIGIIGAIIYWILQPTI